MSTLEDLKAYVDEEITILKTQMEKIMEYHERNSAVIGKILDKLLKKKVEKNTHSTLQST